jgi:hypothetical protein
MSPTIGLMIGFAIIKLGAAGLADFLLWLGNRDAQKQRSNSKHLTQA